MKKLISTVIAGTVVLSLCACSKPAETSASVAETTKATTTQVTTTTTTTEETTTEETEAYVIYEEEEWKSFDELIPSDGEIFMDFLGKNSVEISDNILNATRIRTNTPVETYAKRFEIQPEYTYEDGVWSFYWDDENMPETNTFITLEIKAGNEDGKIVLDQDSSVYIVCYMMEEKRARFVYERLVDETQMDGESNEYLKDGLAINPRRSGHDVSFTGNYDGYDFIRCEIKLRCNIPPLTEEDLALLNK